MALFVIEMGRSQVSSSNKYPEIGFFDNHLFYSHSGLHGAAKMAASLGLEPRQTDPESVVLPLHYEAVVMDR